VVTGLRPAGEFNRTLCSAPENALPLRPSRNFPAHAEAEDNSKIKDRLEALLFAETLQGTLSPNANPRKGVKWRLTVLDAQCTREDSTGHSDTYSLVLDLTVIPK
jgi:hypothetical protein